MSGLTRRRFLRGLVGTIGVAAAGPLAYKHGPRVAEEVIEASYVPATKKVTPQSQKEALDALKLFKVIHKSQKDALDVLEAGYKGARKPGSLRKRAVRGIAEMLKEIGD